jgi:hypothetical protein
MRRLSQVGQRVSLSAITISLYHTARLAEIST